MLLTHLKAIRLAGVIWMLYGLLFLKKCQDFTCYVELLKHGLKHRFGRTGFRLRQGFGQNENIHNKTHRKNSKVHEKSTNNPKNIFISYREKGKRKRKRKNTSNRV